MKDITITRKSDLLLLSSNLNDTIVRFHKDGRIEVNPKYTVDEAAKLFWEKVIKLQEDDLDQSARANLIVRQTVKACQEFLSTYAQSNDSSSLLPAVNQLIDSLAVASVEWIGEEKYPQRDGLGDDC